jgi:hypothetical protein
MDAWPLTGSPDAPALGSALLRVIRSGTSGATVYLLRQPDGRTVAAKVARAPRVDAPAQAARRRLIAPRLGPHLPEVLVAEHGHGQDLLVTACPAVHTLQDLIDRHGPTPPLRAIWHEVVSALAAQWHDTARPGFAPDLATRDHRRRCQRGCQGLDASLTAVYGPPARWQRIIVNGVDHGPWAAIAGCLLALGRPAFHVTCHGDPHAGNVLVDERNRWYLVDWEWTGDHHDWRMMVSHLVGSWYVHDLLATATGRATGGGSLRLTYRRPATPLLDALGGVARPHVQDLTWPERWRQDRTDITRHTALLLLREIPSAVNSGRADLVAPLLGECVRLLTGERHPIHKHLTAEPTLAGRR